MNKPNKNDGGAAFPMQFFDQFDSGIGAVGDQEGMSLRDWFAGQALAGLLASDRGTDYRSELNELNAATTAFLIADKMIEKRGEK